MRRLGLGVLDRRQPASDAGKRDADKRDADEAKAGENHDQDARSADSGTRPK